MARYIEAMEMEDPDGGPEILDETSFARRKQGHSDPALKLPPRLRISFSLHR